MDRRTRPGGGGDKPLDEPKCESERAARAHATAGTSKPIGSPQLVAMSSLALPPAAGDIIASPSHQPYLPTYTMVCLGDVAQNMGREAGFYSSRDCLGTACFQPPCRQADKGSECSLAADDAPPPPQSPLRQSDDCLWNWSRLGCGLFISLVTSSKDRERWSENRTGLVYLGPIL